MIGKRENCIKKRREKCECPGTGTNAVAVGTFAGESNQRSFAVAVGHDAGYSEQGDSAVAIGSSAAGTNQGNNAVAIGQEAGQVEQGANTVAIGSLAGKTSQKENSIILNASGSERNPDQEGFFVDPIREYDINEDVDDTEFLFGRKVNNENYYEIVTIKEEDNPFKRFLNELNSIKQSINSIEQRLDTLENS